MQGSALPEPRAARSPARRRARGESDVCPWMIGIPAVVNEQGMNVSSTRCSQSMPHVVDGRRFCDHRQRRIGRRGDEYAKSDDCMVAAAGIALAGTAQAAAFGAASGLRLATEELDLIDEVRHRCFRTWRGWVCPPHGWYRSLLAAPVRVVIAVGNSAGLRRAAAAAARFICGTQPVIAAGGRARSTAAMKF